MLKCEICNGSDFLKVGQYFKCENCGMKYDLEQLKNSLNVNEKSSSADNNKAEILENKYIGDEKVYRDILQNSSELHNVMEQTADSVMATYDALFQDGAIAEPYYGVLTKSEKAYSYTIKKIDNDSVGKIAINNKIYNDDMACILSGFSDKGYGFGKDIIVSENRQFDEKLILNSDKPVYFPKKILEFALGMKATKQQSAYVYTPADLKGGYHESKFRESMRKTVTKVIEDGILYLIKTISGNHPENFIVTENIDKIDEASNKLKRSLCTAFLITELKPIKNKHGFTMIGSLKVRFSDIDSRFMGTSEETRTLFDRYGIIPDPPINCSDNIHLGDRSNTAYTVWQYSDITYDRYQRNEPLFSYTVVDQLINRNIGLSWDNAIIGELESGEILFSVREPNSGNQISLGRNVVHNFFSESGSGISSQIMSHLSYLIAEGRPVFYIERTADIISMFAEITKGDMFLVKGMDDIKKDFSEIFDFTNGIDDFHDANGTPITLKGWDKKLPKNFVNCIENDFFDSMDPKDKDFCVKYSKSLCNHISIADFVYLRAIYFCFALIALRREFKKVPEIYQNLGGENGIAIVIDGLYNWEDNLGNAFFSRGRSFLNPINPSEINSFMNDMKNEKKRKSALEKRKKWSLSGRPYMHDLYCCLEDIHTHFIQTTSTENAEFMDENWKTDIYIVGRDLLSVGKEYSSVTDNLFNWRETSSVEGIKSVNVVNSRCPSIIMQTLRKLPQDCFLGKEMHDFGLLRYPNEKHNNIHDKLQHGYWLYTTERHDTISSKKFNFNKMDYKIIKPYVVFKNNIEPDFDAENNMSYYEQPRNADCLRGCAERTGLDSWKTIRLKHTTTPQTEDNPVWGELNDGIGFEGLLKRTMKARGKYTGENDYLEVLKKSADIADYVAQKCGYSDWKEFLFDFTPTGLFDFKSLKKALEDPDYKFQATKNVKERAKACEICDCLYPELLHGSIPACEIAKKIPEDSIVNSPEFRVNLDDYVVEESSNKEKAVPTESNTKEIPSVKNEIELTEEDVKYIEVWKKQIHIQAELQRKKSSDKIKAIIETSIEKETKENGYEGELLEKFKQERYELMNKYLEKSKANVYEFRDNILAQAEAENYRSILAKRKR